MGKTEFEEFKKRLYFHNRDREGVDRHITANPIFNVQTKERIYHIEFSEAEGIIYVDSDEPEYSYDSIEELYDSLSENDSETYHKLKKYCDDEDIDFDELYTDEQIDIVENELNIHRCGYIEQWRYVNSHLTREGAEEFIKRKKHDYGEMRIWVGSQNLCWEFNDIIKGILDGEIGYID